MLAAIDAAAFAHAQGVIHRDIKPWNILVGAYGETLLIDWGLARELDETDEARAPDVDDPTALTRAGHAYGTPGFMAPEQTRGEPADRRADVYALGATLFHLLTGVVPLGGMAATAWIATVAAGTPPPREPLGPDVPAELSTGREVARWHVRSVRLYYTRGNLHSFDVDRGRRALDRLSTEQSELVAGTWSVLWNTPAGWVTTIERS